MATLSAIGDGVADDTAALNAAMATASTQGKDVYFPFGTYRTTSAVTVKNGVSCFGDASGISLIKAASRIPFGDSDFGTESTINLRKPGTSEMNGYLKFAISDLAGPVFSAKLRLYSLHDHQVEILRVDDVSWSELSVTWNNRPAMGATIASSAALTGQWLEVDVHLLP